MSASTIAYMANASENNNSQQGKECQQSKGQERKYSQERKYKSSKKPETFIKAFDKDKRRLSAPPNVSDIYNNKTSRMNAFSKEYEKVVKESFTSSLTQSEYYNMISPPSLSPSSSTSSLNSFADKLVANSYENCLEWSPAASYLATLASTLTKSPSSDQEGQQVGEYVLGRIIGHGGFSTVRIGYTIDDYSCLMEKVAVKIVKFNDNNNKNEDNDRIQVLLEREISIWRALDHPNIVKMITAESMNGITFIFSEYCPGGTLLEYLKKNRKSNGDNCKNRNRDSNDSSNNYNRRYSTFSFDTYDGVEKTIVKGLCEVEARIIFLEIAGAIRYLHNDMKLVHKDIKLENILLDRNDHWKLCDFGLTEFQGSSMCEFDNIVADETICGSLAYCSPEQLRSKTRLRNPAIDIWSLGVVLFALATAQLPFMDNFGPRLQFKILNGKYDESLLQDADVSDEFHDLLKRMFKTKSDQRSTITQILDHPWCNTEV